MSKIMRELIAEANASRAPQVPPVIASIPSASPMLHQDLSDWVHAIGGTIEYTRVDSHLLAMFGGRMRCVRSDGAIVAGRSVTCDALECIDGLKVAAKYEPIMLNVGASVEHWIPIFLPAEFH